MLRRSGALRWGAFAEKWAMMGPRLTAERRRALELLASIPYGVNEELLIHGQGLKRQTLVGLIRVGLATAEREVMTADGKPVEVVRIWIRARGGGRSKSEAVTATTPRGAPLTPPIRRTIPPAHPFPFL
jgi:hypothetical protein